MNVFQKIIKEEREFVENIRLRNKQYAEFRKTDDVLVELQRKAKGFDTLFKDDRHICFINFIQGIKKGLLKELYLISLNSKTKESQMLDTRGIAAQVKLLDKLEYDPESFVEEMRRRNKSQEQVTV